MMPGMSNPRPSLAYRDRSVTDDGVEDQGPEPDYEARNGYGGCPAMAGWVMVNVATGEVRPARCRSNRCSYCLRGNARRRARAIEFARPERAVLLSQVGESWPVVRNRMKQLRWRLHRDCGPVEWVWHVEPNPKGTGHHVHAWQWGAYLPQARLSDLAASVGMGRVTFINRVRSARGASNYGLKGLGYGLKLAEDGSDEEGDLYMRLNGARLTHQSRGYFRSDQGEKLTVRAAESAAGRVGRTEDVGQWVLIARESAGCA
jgi:hypothetical protein